MENQHTAESGVFRQSHHVRISPAPAKLMLTSTAFADRFEISPSLGPDAGIYRRVSVEFIQAIRGERDKSQPGSERRDRLEEILSLAEGSPFAGNHDLGNLRPIDLSHY